MQAEVNMLLEHRPAGIAAYAASPRRAVVGASRAGRRCTGVGEHAITELGGHTKYLIMSETRLEGQFPDEIRRRVE